VTGDTKSGRAVVVASCALLEARLDPENPSYVATPRKTTFMARMILVTVII